MLSIYPVIRSTELCRLVGRQGHTVFRPFTTTTKAAQDEKTSQTDLNGDSNRIYWTKGMVLVEDVQSANWSSVLQQVKGLPSPTGNTKASAVFLISKGLASWLNDEAFLEEAVRQVFRPWPGRLNRTGLPSIVDFTALFAVVDLLPSPSPVYGRTGQEHVDCITSQYGRENVVPIDDRGSEGLTYGSSWVTQFLPDTLGDTQTHTFQQFATSTNPATLSFAMQPYLGKKAKGKATTITLPLANTVFSNNRAATMFASHWNYQYKTETLTKVQTTDLNHASVKLYVSGNRGDFGKGDQSFGQSIAISTPLVPLTPLVEVKDAMGNIIRAIAASSEPDSEVVPASQDLERAVASYFVKHDIEAQAVSIWALVVPKLAYAGQPTQDDMEVLQLITDMNRSIKDHLESTGSEVTANKEKTPSRLKSLLWNGASLHRVQSGGGGWGKKAGLLSLDPEVEYKKEEARTLDFDFDNDDLELPTFTGLKTAASPGDYVAFFMHTLDDVDRPKVADVERKSDELRAGSLDFGVIPSTSDNMDNDVSTASAKVMREAKLTIYDNHFGALSETGMAQVITTTKSSEDRKTKIDIPWSRFSVQSLVQSQNPEINQPVQSNDDTNSATEIETSDAKKETLDKAIRSTARKRVSMYRSFKPGSEALEGGPVFKKVVRSLQIRRIAAGSDNGEEGDVMPSILQRGKAQPEAQKTSTVSAEPRSLIRKHIVHPKLSMINPLSKEALREGEPIRIKKIAADPKQTSSSNTSRPPPLLIKKIIYSSDESKLTTNTPNTAKQATLPTAPTTPPIRKFQTKSLIRGFLSGYQQRSETSPTELEQAIGGSGLTLLGNIRAAATELATSGRIPNVSTYDAVRLAARQAIRQRRADRAAATVVTHISPRAKNRRVQRALLRKVKLGETSEGESSSSSSSLLFTKIPTLSGEATSTPLGSSSKDSNVTLTPRQLRRQKARDRSVQQSQVPRIRSIPQALRIRAQLSEGPLVSRRVVDFNAVRGTAVAEKLRRIAKAREEHVLSLLGGEGLPWGEGEVEELVREWSLKKDIGADEDGFKIEDVKSSESGSGERQYVQGVKGNGGRMRRERRSRDQEWDVQAIFEELSKFDEDGNIKGRP